MALLSPHQRDGLHERAGLQRRPFVPAISSDEVPWQRCLLIDRSNGETFGAFMRMAASSYGDSRAELYAGTFLL